MTGHALPYEPLGGDLHRHGEGRPHAHPHTGPHSHEAGRHDEQPGHSHGLVDRSIMRSRKGLQAVGISFAVLGLAAAAQTVIFIASGSIALLADLIHNFGDASTAIPLGIAFLFRSERAERIAGLFVVADWLGVPKSAVALASGQKSRLKSVAVDGEPDKLLEKISKLLADLSQGGGAQPKKRR